MFREIAYATIPAERPESCGDIMTTAPLSARQEWAAKWHLPVIAVFGIVGGTMFPTSSGIFMHELTTTFAWSHVEFASAFTFQVLLGLVTIPLAGRLADRFGSRRVILAGMLPFAASFSLLGLANGSVWQWWGLATLNAFFVACVCPPIWIKPIVVHFNVSRGLALAVALAGIALASSIWPIVSALCIKAFGWRLAYPAMAAMWAVPMFIVTIFFYESGRSAAPAIHVPTAAAEYRSAVLSRTFVCMALAGALFTCVTYGLFVHLVPMLQGNGLTLTAAAGVASMLGIMSIVGRLVVGLLLDRMPTRLLGVAIFLLPAAASLLLWQEGGTLALAMLAVALFGFASGAETDILAYLAARRFPKAVFASVYALATAIFAFSASLGPLLAGATFDASQSYAPFLLLIVPLVSLGALLIWLIPPSHKFGESPS